MNLAEDTLGLLRRRGPACPIGHVQADGMYAVVGTEAGQRLVQALLPHVGDHHLHSGSCKGLGHPQAHATRAASDEGGLSCNVFHAGFPCVTGFGSPKRLCIPRSSGEPRLSPSAGVWARCRSDQPQGCRSDPPRP
jgi:hypothetical protein